jgi:hypothetical protein
MKETTVGALLRLLEYVHGEVSERLRTGAVPSSSKPALNI